MGLKNLLGLGWGWAKGVLGLRVWAQGLKIVQNAGEAVASFVREMKLEIAGQCLLPLRGSAPSSAGGWRTATPGLLN